MWFFKPRYYKNGAWWSKLDVSILFTLELHTTIREIIFEQILLMIRKPRTF